MRWKPYVRWPKVEQRAHRWKAGCDPNLDEIFEDWYPFSRMRMVRLHLGSTMSSDENKELSFQEVEEADAI